MKSSSMMLMLMRKTAPRRLSWTAMNGSHWNWMMRVMVGHGCRSCQIVAPRYSFDYEEVAVVAVVVIVVDVVVAAVEKQVDMTCSLGMILFPPESIQVVPRNRIAIVPR